MMAKALLILILLWNPVSLTHQEETRGENEAHALMTSAEKNDKFAYEASNESEDHWCKEPSTNTSLREKTGPFIQTMSGKELNLSAGHSSEHSPQNWSNITEIKRKKYRSHCDDVEKHCFSFISGPNSIIAKFVHFYYTIAEFTLKTVWKILYNFSIISWSLASTTIPYIMEVARTIALQIPEITSTLATYLCSRYTAYLLLITILIYFYYRIIRLKAEIQKSVEMRKINNDMDMECIMQLYKLFSDKTVEMDQLHLQIRELGQSICELQSAQTETVNTIYSHLANVECKIRQKHWELRTEFQRVLNHIVGNGPRY